ncbi:MAG: hypothetical protein MHM6MM_001845 [Cercozoa sp. M6MM]
MTTQSLRKYSQKWFSRICKSHTDSETEENAADSNKAVTADDDERSEAGNENRRDLREESLLSLSRQLSATRHSVLDTIQLVQEREQSLNRLHQQTDQMTDLTMDFRLGARRVRRRSCLAYVKGRCIAFFVFLLAVALLVLLVYLVTRKTAIATTEPS